MVIFWNSSKKVIMHLNFKNLRFWNYWEKFIKIKNGKVELVKLIDTSRPGHISISDLLWKSKCIHKKASILANGCHYIIFDPTNFTLHLHRTTNRSRIKACSPYLPLSSSLLPNRNDCCWLYYPNLPRSCGLLSLLISPRYQTKTSRYQVLLRLQKF